MAKTFRVLPSQLLRIKDDIAAFYFDRAVSAFGHAVEDAIEKATEGKKEGPARVAAENTLRIWLGQKLKFASPQATR